MSTDLLFQNSRLQLLNASRTGRDPLLETAMKLHDIAMKDEYFIERYKVSHAFFKLISNKLIHHFQKENWHPMLISGTFSKIYASPRVSTDVSF